MSAYPTLAVQDSSGGVEPIDSRTLVRATNGALKVRRLHGTEKVRISIEHWLSSADKTTLDAHYDANLDASFSYTWPGSGSPTYTVVYAAKPRYEEMPGGWFRAFVLLEEA